MKLYISTNARKVIRKNYNIVGKNTCVIDIPHISKNFNIEDYEINIYSAYILIEEIKKQFQYAYLSKRFKNILYIINEITPKVIDNIHMFLKDNNIFFSETVLIDFFDEIFREYYLLFDNVM